MKLTALLTASVIAIGFAQGAVAQDSTQTAAADPKITEPGEPAAAPAPRAEPVAQPASEAKPAPKAVRRRAAPQPQEPQSWAERFFRRNSQNAPADPRARPQSRQAAHGAPAYSTARPPSNRLFLGMFYSIVPKETVAFRENYAPGTILVRQRERRLYYVLGNGQAIRYAIAVGREGAAWSGVSSVSNKREWPSWTPTPAILARQPNLPRFMEGGPKNPMGARALNLGDTLYRIHGTNEPWMIGEEASSGCIRMTNDDVVDLYNRARLGATVIVTR